MDDTDVFQRLQKSYREKFWMMLFSDMEHVELSVNKLLSSKSIPTDRWDDFKQELWIRCLNSFPRYQQSRSSFNTWMIWQAQGLLRDVLRKPKKKAPIYWELTFTDLKTERSETDLSFGGDYNDRDPKEERVEESDDLRVFTVEVNRELVEYAQLLREDPEMALRFRVFEELCLSCWEISDREIARHLGMSHPWIGKERKAIVAELRIRLSRVDVSNVG